jgi:hypothetical protein
MKSSRPKEEPMRYAWLDQARGVLRRDAAAQTYEDARAQLHGAAWREMPKSTDAWFVLDDGVDIAEAVHAPAQRRWLLPAIVASSAVILVGGLLLGARAHGGSGATVAPMIVKAPTGPAAAEAIPRAALPPASQPPAESAGGSRSTTKKGAHRSRSHERRH